MKVRRPAALLVLAAILAAPAAHGAPSAYFADGLGEEWSAEDVVGVSFRAPIHANATLDLTALSAADNATHWFFRLSFSWLASPANATLALYLFGPDDGSPGVEDPLGNAVALPEGAPLDYALYMELSPAFPSGSKAVFFDGVAWKNRTFAELGIAAARNDTASFVELAAQRDSLTFLEAGSAAAALLVPDGPSPGAPLALADAVPDDPKASPGALAGRVAFFDYTYRPPIVFTALGLSNPAPGEGDAVGIFIELTNLGPKNATGISAQVLMDGTVLSSREGLVLLGHNGTQVIPVNWTASAGEHNVSARSFPGGALRSLTLRVTPAGAQLSIDTAEARPPNPALGEDFTVEVRVRNDGSAASSAGRLLLKDGTQVIATAALPSIFAGESTVVQLPAHAGRAGPLLLRVEVDGLNSANGTRLLEIVVAQAQPPFGVPAVVWLVAGVAACAGAAWALTPRLSRRRRPKE